MSSGTRGDLVMGIGMAISRWQDATEKYDEKVGDVHGLISAERRTLSLVTHGPQPANVIAKYIGLTPAAVTSLIDRLTDKGFVKRRHDSEDRRKVLVEATAKTKDLERKAYQPVFEAGAKLLEGFKLEELKTIKRFVEEVTDMQNALAEKLI